MENNKIMGILIGIAAIIAAVGSFIGVTANAIETAKACKWLEKIGDKWSDKFEKITDEMLD